jgi:hypothetical protein
MSFAEASIRSDVLKKDSATLSSAYFDGYYTNKSLLNFNLEVLRASNRGLKCLENEKLWIRIVLGVFYMNSIIKHSLLSMKMVMR